MDPVFTPAFVLLLAGVGFMSLLILFLILLLCQRAFKYKQGYQLPTAQVNEQGGVASGRRLMGFFFFRQKCNMDIDLEKLRDNSAYHCIGSQMNPCLEKLEYSRNDIIYIKDLGQGAFGRVFQVNTVGGCV
jgi:muscle, skeletal, receptor tyrosine kinase